jgi:tRNA 5-methylaminomethyl-2-thiouridine biosynthesis bifunctional protein
LTGLAPPTGAQVHGRVAWRERAPDRLPVVGAALDAAACGAARSDPSSAARRGVARIPGLFVVGGMAGRGFTWGPLAGEVLASWVDGSPQVLEADLLDALDPARFWLRQQRRAAPAAAGQEP